MEQLLKKLKQFFLPYLAVALIFPFVYAFLVWLFIRQLNTITIRDEITEVWLPVLLAFIPVLLWLLPRFRQLDLKGKYRDALYVLVILAVAGVSVPAILLQKYLSADPGRLTELKNIKAIAFNPPTKYYTVESFYPDKNHTGAFASFEETGKGEENLNINIYIAVPMLAVSGDTLNEECPAWLGIKYKKQISNTLSPEDREKAYGFFIETCNKDFRSKNLRDFSCLSRTEEGNENDGYREAIKNNHSYKPDFQNILLPLDKPAERRSGGKLAWIFISFILSLGLMLLVLLMAGSRKEHVEENVEETDGEENRAGSFIEFIKPREGFFFTPILMLLNILVFAVMVIAGLGFITFRAEDLLTWGGNYRPLTLNGEYWRLLTNVFLHGGLMHLLANLYGLLFVGVILEPQIGKGRFIFSYLFTGIIASCASIWWHGATISVGASGAIFGLYGLFVFLMVAKVLPSEVSRTFLVSTLIFIGYNLVMGLRGGIDNAAHIGGLVGGIVVGMALYPSFAKPELKIRNYSILCLSVAATITLSSILLAHKSDPATRYNALMAEFTKTEQKAMGYFNLPSNSSAEKRVETLKNEGIPAIKQCRQIAEKIDSIENLPADLSARNNLMKRYCDYRLTSYELMAEAFEKKTEKNIWKLKLINEKIALIVRKFEGEEIADSLLVLAPVVTGTEKIIYVVDGVAVDDAGDILPQDIDSITVLKGEASYQVYGERGRDGAILINTKKGK